MNFGGDPAHSNRQGHERRRVKRLLQLAGAALSAVLCSVDSEAAPILILAGDSNSSIRIPIREDTWFWHGCATI